ncbi:LodA/GoxA family CTQ-dependent oxidase [Flavobacterium sp.]|uniref:LodA/GoxA family CTQ-dependent oxidase n=1 Tax=Flavobacterium sp. TaxID=239 RepID=UPI004047CECB
MGTDKTIQSVAIYPPVGIARIGNSSEYYFASDLPNAIEKPDGGFKDNEGKVKKQVARFRIYGFNAEGEVVREITAAEAKIGWRVHVANVKSAWYEFNNALDLEGYAIPSTFRNGNVKGDDREQLVINPGIKKIEGRSEKGKPEYELTGGKFYGKNVPLGKIETDEEGRLLFFGGDGDSASYDNKPATTFANNVGWHDDTSDGIIRASVVIDGKIFEAEPAMVAVTPPNFGPGLFGVVTMYDVVLNLFIEEFNYPDPTIVNGVNFWEHIYPVLERMTNTQWVNQGFFMLFGKNSPSDFTNPELLNKLSNPSEDAKSERERIFNWLRDPNSTIAEPKKIPPFYGDGFGDYTNIALDDLPITKTQYKWFEKWAKGDFNNNKIEEITSFNELSPDQQINALNSAPFEECLGGPFHPGIELTWPMRNAKMWKEPFRLNVLSENEMPNLDYGSLLSPAIALADDGPLSASGPGSLTRWLGVPWQTDEASCLSGYDTTTYLPLPSFWAARVPNQILSEDSYTRMSDKKMNIGQRLKHFDYRQDWLREFGTQYLPKINKMISEWHDLGIIAETEHVNQDTEFLPDRVWKETRMAYTSIDPTMEQVRYAERVEQERLLKSAHSDSNRRTKKRPFYGRNER